MNTERNTFRLFLKQKGLKLTPEREQILVEVFSIHRHFDADKLFEILRSQGSNISLATIYRTLPLLVACGLIRETISNQGKSSYEHIFGHEHHDHLVCLNCGRIIEFNESAVSQIKDSVCKRYNFKSVEYKLGIKGYCKNCTGV